jgi:hypothetical protein
MIYTRLHLFSLVLDTSPKVMQSERYILVRVVSDMGTS